MIKHNIARVALASAALAAGLRNRADHEAAFAQLHDYALGRRDVDREKKFPSPEVLARKWHELRREPFPAAKFEDVPFGMQVAFTVFRAVIEALEPFRTDQPSPIDGEIEAALDPAVKAAAYDADAPDLASVLNEAGCERHEQLIDMAKVGSSLMNAIAVHTSQDGPLKDWAPAEDPAEIVGDLVSMIEGEPIELECDPPAYSAQTAELDNIDDTKVWLGERTADSIDKGVQMVRWSQDENGVLLFEGWPAGEVMGTPHFHYAAPHKEEPVKPEEPTNEDPASVAARTKAGQQAMDEAAKPGQLDQNQQPMSKADQAAKRAEGKKAENQQAAAGEGGKKKSKK